MFAGLGQSLRSKRLSEEKNKQLEIVVTGLGMVTPVGYNAKQTCASIRADIARLNESEEFRIPNEKGHMTTVVCGAVTGVTDGHRRFLRLLRMAKPAYSEVIVESKLSQDDINQSGLYLILPEQDRPGMDNRAEESLANRICDAIEIDEILSRTKVFALGHTGVFFALQEAMKDLTQGIYRYAIIGAVDTYIDEITLEFFQDFNQLKTEDNSKGFIPGEGAAFFTLEKHQTANERKITPLAKIEGVFTALEENTIYEDTPCKGDGLSESIQNTLSSLNDEGTQTGLVICDLNGERYRSLEWGLVLPRALGNNQIPITTWHPADCIGDTGAASGTINICVGVTALVRGYAKTTNILVWGASDDGERGSAYIRAV